jgi:hypothetical protein
LTWDFAEEIEEISFLTGAVTAIAKVTADPIRIRSGRLFEDDIQKATAAVAQSPAPMTAPWLAFTCLESFGDDRCPSL